jgi:hypothetical protein
VQATARDVKPVISRPLRLAPPFQQASRIRADRGAELRAYNTLRVPKFRVFVVSRGTHEYVVALCIVMCV